LNQEMDKLTLDASIPLAHAAVLVFLPAAAGTGIIPADFPPCRQLHRCVAPVIGHPAMIAQIDGIQALGNQFPVERFMGISLCDSKLPSVFAILNHFSNVGCVLPCAELGDGSCFQQVF